MLKDIKTFLLLEKRVIGVQNFFPYSADVVVVADVLGQHLDVVHDGGMPAVEGLSDLAVVVQEV